HARTHRYIATLFAAGERFWRNGTVLCRKIPPDTRRKKRNSTRREEAACGVSRSGEIALTKELGPPPRRPRSYVPAAEFAGVEVDDPVGDATISSVGHRPSSIVASNRDQQFR